MVFMIFSLSGFEVKAESCGQVTRKIFTLLIVIYNFIQAVICQLMILSITAIPKEQSVSTTMLGKIAILKTLEKSKMVTHTPRIHGDRRAKPLYMEEKYGSKKISRVFSLITCASWTRRTANWSATWPISARADSNWIVRPPCRPTRTSACGSN